MHFIFIYCFVFVYVVRLMILVTFVGDVDDLVTFLLMVLMIGLRFGYVLVIGDLVIVWLQVDGFDGFVGDLVL